MVGRQWARVLEDRRLRLGSRELCELAIDRRERISVDEEGAAHDLELGAALVERNVEREAPDRVDDFGRRSVALRGECLGDGLPELQGRRGVAQAREPRMLTHDLAQYLLLTVERADGHFGETVEAAEQADELVVRGRKKLLDDCVTVGERGAEPQGYHRRPLESLLNDLRMPK